MKSKTPDPFAQLFESANLAYGEGRFFDALDLCLQAERLESKHPILLANMAACLYELGRFDEAEQYSLRSIELRDDYNRSRITLGMIRLLNGDYQRGWPDYEWTGTLFEKFTRLPPKLKWQGEPFAPGERVLVIDEQGYGDTIQFIRFAADLVAAGAEVFCDVKPPLRRLIKANPQLGSVLNGEEKIEIGKWTRLMSIPHLNRVGRDDLLRHSPYLTAPALRPDSCLNHPAVGKRVGLIWKGSDANARDAMRSLTASDLAPILSLARQNSDLEFFHLHNQSFQPEIESAGVVDCLTELCDEMEDFADLAAIIDAMDLVICIDTAVAHLAGALGKPVLCLISFVADWRWGRSGESSDWYPNTQLFRQKQPDCWQQPLAEVRSALLEL